MFLSMFTRKFLSIFLNYLNDGFKEKITLNHLGNFLKMELYMRLYQCSASRVTAIRNMGVYEDNLALAEYELVRKRERS